MKTIINGEAPFQVLTQNFSIGPADAYTLQISADGVNYSDLFSVGADVTRMVSDVAAGSFYRLAGNGRDGVVINWMKSCGEGGGSGEAGVASLNGQKGNLTLKTINGNDLLGGGNIEIEGGSSDILKARTEFPSEAEDGDVVAIKASEGGENIITIKKEDWAVKMGIANRCPILDGDGVGLIFCEFWGDVNFGDEWKDYEDLVTNEWTEYEQNGTTISARYDKDGDGILQIKVLSGDYKINPHLSLIVNDPTKKFEWSDFDGDRDKHYARIELKETGDYLMHSDMDNSFFLGGTWDGSNFEWGYGQTKDDYYFITAEIIDGFIVGFSEAGWENLDAYGTSTGLHQNGVMVSASAPSSYGVYQKQGEEWKPVGNGGGSSNSLKPIAEPPIDIQNGEVIAAYTEYEDYKEYGIYQHIDGNFHRAITNEDGTIFSIKVLTQDEYEALGDNKDMTTLYIIKG